MDDAQRLFAWRNDPVTRANSKTLDLVEWASHIGWLERRLTRPDPLLFIAEKGGQLVGTFRIDDDEISYTVAPEHRGKGVATMMLAEAYARFGRLRAEIKRENLASIKAARSAGYQVKLI